MKKIAARKLAKWIIFVSTLVLIFPLILVAWIEKKASKNEIIFVSLGQLLSLIPGRIGSYFRSAYYFATLEQSSWEVYIGFGSFFSHRAASLGSKVSMGSYCIIGTVAIEDEVMMASRISITSGKHQHFDESGNIVAAPRFDKITIGRKTWIGEGAIILANIGSNCIVSAGTIVINEASQSRLLIAGNPGRIIKDL